MCGIHYFHIFSGICVECIRYNSLFWDFVTPHDCLVICAARACSYHVHTCCVLHANKLHGTSLLCKHISMPLARVFFAWPRELFSRADWYTPAPAFFILFLLSFPSWWYQVQQRINLGFMPSLTSLPRWPSLFIIPVELAAVLAQWKRTSRNPMAMPRVRASPASPFVFLLLPTVPY